MIFESKSSSHVYGFVYAIESLAHRITSNKKFAHRVTSSKKFSRSWKGHQKLYDKLADWQSD